MKTIEEIIYLHSTQHPRLAKLIEERCFEGDLPKGAELPAFCFRREGPFFEFEVYGATHEEAKTAGVAVIAAWQGFRGVVGGVSVILCRQIGKTHVDQPGKEKPAGPVALPADPAVGPAAQGDAPEAAATETRRPKDAESGLFRASMKFEILTPTVVELAENETPKEKRKR